MTEQEYPKALEKAGFCDVNVNFFTIVDYAPDNADVSEETALLQINTQRLVTIASMIIEKYWLPKGYCMDKQRKKYQIGMIVSMVLTFLWLVFVILLTKGKEIEDFLLVERYIFIGFLIIESITIAFLFVFVVKLSKINHKTNQDRKPVSKSTQEKIIRRRGLLLLLCAGVFAFSTMVAGMLAGKKFPDIPRAPLLWILAVCCILPFLLFPLSLWRQKKFIRKFQQQQVEDLQQYLLSHRVNPEETVLQKLAFLKSWKCWTDLYAAMFSLFALGIAFCTGMLFITDLSVPLWFVSAFFFFCTLSRVRFSVTPILLEEDKTYLAEEKYPELYALARKAADTLACKGKIKIAVLSDGNAGIAKIGNIYSVQIGVILLHVFSQEELFHTLLHEFAHMTGENNLSSKESRYNNWICVGGNPNFFSGLTVILFCYFDAVYQFHYHLYLYAASILNETAADQAMMRYGNAAIAASSLLKLKYYELFQWERETYDDDYLYMPEELNKELMHHEIESFRKAMQHRADHWNHLVNVEILSRTASHPTLKMRLDALGVTDPSIVESNSSPAYLRECDNALIHLEELIYQDRMETYSEERKASYLEPKSKVEAWEEAGKPLVAEEYADIDFALRKLGRVAEANELCDRAIAELSDSAGCYAYFTKGCFLLHRYNKAGIDYVYRAIENNYIYIDGGLEAIGEFCCLTGDQEELDRYREKALVFAQKEKDEYSQTNLLHKNDHLTSEQLPDGMLEEIISFIRSVDDGSIQNIYLVRKIITEDFFTSVFVVQFEQQCEEEKQNKILHKIFCYLDTSSNWHFSLFNYYNVTKVKIESIANSCVYSKAGNPSFPEPD